MSRQRATYGAPSAELAAVPRRLAVPPAPTGPPSPPDPAAPDPAAPDPAAPDPAAPDPAAPDPAAPDPAAPPPGPPIPEAPIPEARWDTAVGLLRGLVGTRRQVGLFAHVNPDSDSLGSALALGLALRELGAQVSVSFDADPFRVPDGLAFLPGLDLLVAPSAVPTPLPLAVTLDVGSPGRLGRVSSLLDEAGHVVVVDHHRSNTPFGDTRLVDPAAASTSVVVTELLDRLGVALTPDVATALYAGLVTDTGSFRQSSTSPAAHALAARLVAGGADPTSVGWSVWGIHRLDYVRLLGAVLGRVRVEPAVAAGRGLVWTTVTRADFAAHHLDISHVEGVVDVLWGVREAEVAAVLKELPGGGWTASLRSRGGVDVGAVAAALGGGGHPEKAGYVTGLDEAGALAALREVLDPTSGRP